MIPQAMDTPEAPALRSRYLPRLQAEIAALARTAALRLAVARGTRAPGAAAAPHHRLRALEAALRRIDSGAFGRCARCGDFIGHARLEHDPAHPHCDRCAP